ncbi:MAG: thioredoxin-dependent thiol peroxidase [Alphaproteobacteria bacterium]|nr:thioredoxin-dependent thiol peroxidase [Alphaproteobacteria bacterium]MBV9694188.1 thioredoxin-dependent thiol peroxidase [Alphaproteobacteria bacterium]
MDLKPGDKAPPFKLSTDGGGTVSLAALKGRPFVLYFYPKDNTPGCTLEAQGFSENVKKFQRLGVEVVGISKDDVASHERFKSKYGLKLVLASDPDVETAKAYGVWGEKTLYGRKFMGMERATFLVDSRGTVREIWRKVKVAGHVEAVLAAAKAL